MADFINATIDDREFEHLIKAMNDKGVHLKPVLAAVGNLAVKSVKQNFREGGRPDKWTPSNKPKGKTLIGTGALMKSIHYKVDDDESGVTIMTGPQKYAAIHQFGGTTSAHTIMAKNRKSTPIQCWRSDHLQKESQPPRFKNPGTLLHAPARWLLLH